MPSAAAQPGRPRLLAGISRNTLLLGLVSLFNDISSDMIHPHLTAVFLRTVLGASTTWVGVIEGLAQSTASVLKPLSGYLSDRVRMRKPGILLGYWLSACARPLLAMAGAAWHVLGLRFADRLGKGARTAPRDAMIADSTGEDYRGKAYGLHRALDNAGAALGMLAASLILLGITSDLRIVFLLAAVPGMIAVCIVVWGVREVTVCPSENDANATRHGGSPAPPGLLKWYAVVFVFWLGNSADAFLVLKAYRLGLPIWQLPLLMFVMSVVRAVFSMPAGALSDRLGRKGVIVTGWIYYAVVYAGFALASERWLLYALFGAYGLYYAITEGAERALVADLAPEAARATALGLYHFVVGAAALPASVICGVLWEWDRLGDHGPHVALGFGAGCALIATVLFVIFNPRTSGSAARGR